MIDIEFQVIIINFVTSFILSDNNVLIKETRPSLNLQGDEVQTLAHAWNHFAELETKLLIHESTVSVSKAQPVTVKQKS